MERFWVYIDNKVQGPVEIPSLRKLSGFTLLSQVCAEGQETWRIADEVIEIKAYFSAPPRGSSLVPDAQPELLSAEKNQIEMSLPMPGLSTEARVTSSALRNPDVEVLETLEEPAPVTVNGAPQPGIEKESSPTGNLRVSCVTCGYKNPRDVNVCMKCGTPLKTAAAKPEGRPAATLEILADAPIQKENIPSLSKVESSPRLSANAQEARPDNPVVEIPVTRILIILLSVSLAGGTFFVGRQMWKAKHRHVVTIPKEVSGSAPAPVPVSTGRHQVSKRRHGVPNRHLASVLPGVSPTASSQHRTPKAAAAVAPDTEATPAIATYKVLPQAYPLQHRTSAPVDSKYSVKRRGDKGLWASQEDAAIQQAESQRIYGGQRTIARNTDILMQVLRDREYSTAFESGKRLYLLNDIDWAASEKDGPLYEVQLTFSGGKEADGSPRAPLRFAFDVDLDRQTVEPGGSGTVRANTLRAYFDESRIPPEERRSVAKDTEELVKAAQPDASPLALETISKHYAETYSYPALTRVANAYGLDILNKKLEHETKSINDVLPETVPSAAKPRSEPAPSAVAQNKAIPMPSASGSIQYTMERGEGKERLLTVEAPSRATPRRLWETITGYDRFTQFVPDMLVSQREGQDGPAVIVHTTSLTRLMVFVFKINLHLRILEHPQQYRIEFERIAGDFEKFSGYAEITPDPTGTRSIITLHVTIAPKGYLPDWIVRDMARKFVVPVVDAMRSQSEAN